MMMKKNKENNVNGVKGAYSQSEGPSPGRCSVGEQHRPGRQSATAQTTTKRIQWTVEDNKELMLCYYKSRHPSKNGYLKRFYQLWQNRNDNQNVTKQNLADRARKIENKGWIFTKLELEEIKLFAEGKQKTQHTMELSDNVSSSSNGKIVSTEELEQDNNRTRNDTFEFPQNMDKEAVQILLKNLKKIKEDDLEIPNLKHMVNKKRFMKIIEETNKIAEYIPTNNITETLQLIKAIILTVAENMGLEIKEHRYTKNTKNIPPWKKRMMTTLTIKRSELSQLTEMKQKKLKNQQIIDQLHRKYFKKDISLVEIIETLKQEILALKNKIERYTTRCEFYRQNKLFETNQKRFYDSLEKKVGDEEKIPKSPSKSEVMKFWSKIWGNEKKHNMQANWITNVEDELKSTSKQVDLKITKKMIKKAIMKAKNWKAAGKDGVQAFWLKTLTSLHDRMADQLQSVLDGNIPTWMATGKTTLILKNPDEPMKASNYRPITCLPTIWKLLTSIIANEIYTFMESNKLIPWQQKGNKRKSHGTKDQLLIDKLILKTAKKKRRNLRMVWIDYQKAYDSVPHSWILKCLKMYRIADNVIMFLEKSILLWQTVLQLNQETIGVVLIKCGIFQGDSLSPILFIICLIPLSHLLSWNIFGFKIGNHTINHLLYMDDLKLYGKNDKEIDSLTNTVRIFSADINMKFGLSKCAKVTINKGKMETSDVIKLPNGEEIKSLNLEDEYKYLGILESDDFHSNRIKTKAKAEYKRRLRLILKSKLHGRNQVTAINTFALPVLTYPAGIIKFTLEEKKKMDTMTRKQMTMHGSLHPRADVDRLYVSRKEGGRGLLSVEDSLNKEENSLAQYVDTTQEPILKLTKEIMLNKSPQTKEAFAKTIETKRKAQWNEKKIHGLWPKNLDKYSKQTNLWLQKSNLKPSSESLITAAQDQAIRTKWYESNILKTTSDETCRRCGEFRETVEHIVSGCPELAQGVYLNRHNTIASYIHWWLCHREGLPCSKAWYDHTPEKVLENENTKILFDFNIMTDKKIEHRRPDLVIHKKKELKTTIIDFACPMDRNVEEKEKEKINKYQDLKFELEKTWKTKIKIIPIIVGALGTVTRNLETHLKTIELGEIKVHQLQKCVLLKSGNILRKHLAI